MKQDQLRLVTRMEGMIDIQEILGRKHEEGEQVGCNGRGV
jgi:hypothetical protein